MSRPVVVILVVAVLAPAAIARALNPSVDDGPRRTAQAVAGPTAATAASLPPVASQLRRELARAQDRRAGAAARRASGAASRHRTRHQARRTQRSVPVSRQRAPAPAPVQQPAPTPDTGPAPTPQAPSNPAPHRTPASPPTGTGTFDDSG
jgi:hypothetical protein